MKILQITAVAMTALMLSSPAVSQDQKMGTMPMKDSGAMHSSMGQGAMGHAAMTSSPNAAKAAYDHQFLDTMVAHHQGAVEMAQLAETRSARDELKTLAKKMIEDQQSEIKQMQDWKAKWYAGKGDAMNMKMPGMHESMKGMSMDKIAASKGAAFDAMFIDMMTKHHAGAVTMARNALKKAEHPEVKEIAKKMIDAQKEEMAQMKKWKAEWKVAKK